MKINTVFYMALACLAGRLQTAKAELPTGIVEDPKTCDPSDYVYPEGINNFRGDPGVSMYVAIVGAVTPGITIYETPLAIRLFSLLAALEWGCIAAYDVDKMDALRMGSRPIVEVPPTLCEGTVDAHVTSARAMCLAYGYGAMLSSLVPGAVQGFQDAFEFLSTNFTTIPPSNTGAFPSPFPAAIHPEIQECDDATMSYGEFKVCANAVATSYHFKPEIVGSALAMDVLKFGLEDGFNQDGTNNGKCEYNCRPYADTTGYSPVNGPNVRRRSRPSIKKRWEPLLEDNGRGFFYRQEHVTPHIGTKAKPRILTPEDLASRELNDPSYDLVLEAGKVVDRMAAKLTPDEAGDKIKMQIEFFDDKTNVIALFGRALGIRYTSDYTLERVILFCNAYVAAEYDAVLLSWKEKVRHDLVRPTTVVQQRRYSTPRSVYTWAGPGEDIQTFAAKDFQPYKRVMPHAEYPSGSGCICTANIETVQTYMKIVFNDTVSIDDPINFLFAPFEAGGSNVEPGITPANDLTLIYPNLRAVRDACGDSRLDGGMHFESSVPQSYELCAGLGDGVEEYILYLLNGTIDLITQYDPNGAGGGPPGGGPPPSGIGGAS